MPCLLVIYAATLWQLSFTSHIAAREAPQFAVYERHEMIERRPVTFAPRDKQFGNAFWRLSSHSSLFLSCDYLRPGLRKKVKSFHNGSRVNKERAKLIAFETVLRPAILAPLTTVQQKNQGDKICLAKQCGFITAPHSGQSSQLLFDTSCRNAQFLATSAGSGLICPHT